MKIKGLIEKYILLYKETTGLLFLLTLILYSSAIAYEFSAEGTIPLKDRIADISVNPLTGKAVAISREMERIYTIDLVSKKIVHEASLGIKPTGLAVDIKRDLAIISSAEGVLHFYDISRGETIKAITIKHKTDFLSQTCCSDNRGYIPIKSITINPKTDMLFIGITSGLMVMDLKTEAIINEISLPSTPLRMAVDFNLDYLFELMEGEEGLFIYNTETLALNTEIKPAFMSESKPASFSNIGVNPSTHLALITHDVEDNITLASVSQDRENPVVFLDSITFCHKPEAVAIDSYSNIALISCIDGIYFFKLQNPLPKIELLVPDSARAGESGFMLSIEGERFIKDSKVQFNEKNVQTYFLTNENLKARISSQELSTPGDVPVTVTNPPPGGGISNTFIFKIYNPAPILEAILPDSLYTPFIGTQPVILRVYGRNFRNGSRVNINGEDLKTKFISSIYLEAEISPSTIKSPGKYIVFVINPAPDRFSSNPLYLNVVEVVPSQIINQKKEEEFEILKNKSGTLRGRVLNTNKEPVEGVTVRIKNKKAITDADGYFVLSDIPAGKVHIIIDGSTSTDKYSRYPTIPITINIEPDRINGMPFQIYLHRQKNWNFKLINPDEDTVLTDPEVPGFEMRIPKGIKIIGWDGKPNLKVSVRTVPTDRLPVKPLPKDAFVRTIYMFYFDKIGGGIPDVPIPVKFPNDLGLLPGQKALIWYYDESPNEGEAPNDWAIAGTGTVTPDGRYIVSDPGVGIPKFCCGATGPGCPGACPSGPGPGGGPDGGC